MHTTGQPACIHMWQSLKKPSILKLQKGLISKISNTYEILAHSSLISWLQKTVFQISLYDVLTESLTAGTVCIFKLPYSLGSSLFLITLLIKTSIKMPLTLRSNFNLVLSPKFFCLQKTKVDIFMDSSNSFDVLHSVQIIKFWYCANSYLDSIMYLLLFRCFQNSRISS